MRGLADRQPLSVAAVRRGRRRQEAVPDGVLDAEVGAGDRLVAVVLAHRLQAAEVVVMVPAERPAAAGRRQVDSRW
jgi:hypothetical protein